MNQDYNNEENKYSDVNVSYIPIWRNRAMWTKKMVRVFDVELTDYFFSIRFSELLDKFIVTK